MNNEKLENLLNLALDATSEEREKSLELNVGYDNISATGKSLQKPPVALTPFWNFFRRLRSDHY